jgi:hypothetical protein
MAYAGHYHHQYDAQVARCRNAARKKRIPAVFQDRDHISAMDLEFSEYGRNTRFVPGWFILPAAVLGMAIIAALLLVV